MLGLTGLCVIGHVPQQSGRWLGGAAVRRPHHQDSATYASSEGGGPEVDGRQADAVGGSVRHHAAVVAAAATACDASFLLEVLSQAPARPGLLYLGLHLGDKRPWHVRRKQTIYMTNFRFKQWCSYLAVAETVENWHKETLQDDMNVLNVLILLLFVVGWRESATKATDQRHLYKYELK